MSTVPAGRRPWEGEELGDSRHGRTSVFWLSAAVRIGWLRNPMAHSFRLAGHRGKTAVYPRLGTKKVRTVR